jgi:ligand-binding SRPBCC domain-containing protein
MSKVYSFKKVQHIEASIEEVWDFFSSPANLADITPGDMGFVVHPSTSSSDKIYAGQLIEYTVKPLLGIPVYWMTEITHVREHEYFVDEQRYGPYSFWHHQHHFKQTPGGIEMTDIVHYKIPFWFIGDIANSVIVGRKLKKIFEFRRLSVEKKFGI